MLTLCEELAFYTKKAGGAPLPFLLCVTDEPRRSTLIAVVADQIERQQNDGDDDGDDVDSCHKNSLPGISSMGHSPVPLREHAL